MRVNERWIGPEWVSLSISRRAAPRRSQYCTWFMNSPVMYLYTLYLPSADINGKLLNGNVFNWSHEDGLSVVSAVIYLFKSILPENIFVFPPQTIYVPGCWESHPVLTVSTQRTYCLLQLWVINITFLHNNPFYLDCPYNAYKHIDCVCLVRGSVQVSPCARHSACPFSRLFDASLTSKTRFSLKANSQTHTHTHLSYSGTFFVHWTVSN